MYKIIYTYIQIHIIQFLPFSPSEGFPDRTPQFSSVRVRAFFRRLYINAPVSLPACIPSHTDSAAWLPGSGELSLCLARIHFTRYNL